MTVEVLDVIRVTARMEQHGEAAQNVYHVRNTGATYITDAGFQSALGVWLENIYSPLVPHQDGDLDYIDIEWRNLTQDLPTQTFGWPTLTDGTSAGQMLPQQCAAMVLLPTTGARRVGRKYLPGFTENEQENGGEWTAGFLASLATAASYIQGGFVAEGQSVSSGTWDHILLLFYTFIFYAVDTLVRTQRRRVKGVGI